MASSSGAASRAQERDTHSEPINFRAALAAFEQNSSTHAGSPGTATRRAPQTPARPSAALDPIARSATTPHNRSHSHGRANAASNNPFSAANAPASPRVATRSIPTTSASGMLSALSPAAIASTSPSYATGSALRKSESGLSLRELMNKSLPRSSNSNSPVPPSRSRSGADDDSTTASASASASGRATPAMAPRAIAGLFAEDPTADGLQRTASPASSLFGDERTARHMLDTSLDEQDHTHPMFAHAVMPRSTPGSPERKGSASSTASASSTTPRLPPRPTHASLAPSPTLTEFGQLQPAVKDKAAVGYATYTPGFKRGVATMDVQRTPPALPPRSATVGQSERSKPRELPPSVPNKPLKPAPPPRPTSTSRSAPDGAARGFRFGATESTPAQPAPPPRPQKPSTPGASSLTANTASTASTASHKKSGSNVFTSISLSDEASSELRRTLETDVRSEAQLPPPARGRPPPTTPLRTASTATGGVVSSLIGTAASALPLFKATSTPAGAAGARSLADGAPSKQYGAVSRSGSTHSDLSVRPGQADGASWIPTRAVQLADAPKRTPAAPAVPAVPRWWKTPDESARARYEALFATIADQARRRKHSRLRDENASNASTVREDKPRASGVQALRGWFESDAPPTSDTDDNTTDTNDDLSAASVRRVWKRSRLPPRFLARVWDYAVQAGSKDKRAAPAVGREAFVCALATIDAELARRKARRTERSGQASTGAGARGSVAREAGARRVPPPPRAV